MVKKRMASRGSLFVGVVALFVALIMGAVISSKVIPRSNRTIRPSPFLRPGINVFVSNDHTIIPRHGRIVSTGLNDVPRKRKRFIEMTNMNLQMSASEKQLQVAPRQFGKKKKGKCCVLHKAESSIADCSNQRRRDVPLHLPANITLLNMSRNILSVLPTEAFRRYPNLTILDLSKNVISEIAGGSFLGLSHLKLLDLARNRLNFNNCSRLCCNSPFAHLSGLSTLNVSVNLYHLLPSSLDECMRGLNHLEYLSITFTSEGRFGPGFRNMTSLKILDLSLSYKLTFVKNDFFRNLQTLKLKNLSLARCNLSFIDPDALGTLPYLEVLDLSNNEYLGLNNASYALKSLRNSSLKVLSISRLVDPTKRDTIIVTPSIFKNIAHTNLTELNMDYNSIAKIEPTALETLPQSLKILSVRKNKLADQYNFLRPLLRLVNLEYLNAEDQKAYTPPKRLDLGLVTSDDGESAVNKVKNITIPVPPKLTFLKFTNGNPFRFGGKHVTFVNSTIRKLYLNGNQLRKFFVWIKGLDTVEIMDLSYNQLMIRPGFFDGFTSLRYLYLFDNKLNSTLAGRNAGEIFKKNYNLISLRLGKNDILKLWYKVFQNNSMLENLSLDGNKLTRLGSRIGHLKRLVSLDLSKNAFAYLDTSEINDLEMIARNRPIKVNLAQNPLVCSCESLPFLKWASSLQENITLDKFNSMSCLAPNGTVQFHLSDLKNIVRELDVRCASYVGLMISLSLALLTTVLVVSGGLMYRFRWRLRYIYHIHVLRKFLNSSRPHARYGYRPINGCEPDSVHDIFVAYADEDMHFVTGDMLHELETKEHLTMYIRDRDSMPGLEIATNITRAVRYSSVTLLLLSRPFLRNHWCNYEFQMALVESTKRREQVLLYLMYEDIPSSAMPDDLLAAMKTGKLIEKPSEATDGSYNDTFWAMLVQAIREIIKKQNDVPSLAI
ncbi:toll-like receptor 4 [Liolophura sinensis]|uniref:toll-like receptor 4 n=1 Tax=Liolophura sinensis TaxID=3198878 RepID=UPI003157FD1B